MARFIRAIYWSLFDTGYRRKFRGWWSRASWLGYPVVHTRCHTLFTLGTNVCASDKNMGVRTGVEDWAAEVANERGLQEHHRTEEKVVEEAGTPPVETLPCSKAANSSANPALA